MCDKYNIVEVLNVSFLGSKWCSFGTLQAQLSIGFLFYFVFFFTLILRMSRILCCSRQKDTVKLCCVQLSRVNFTNKF